MSDQAREGAATYTAIITIGVVKDNVVTVADFAEVAASIAGSLRNVAAVYDDETGELAAGVFTLLPALPAPPPEGVIFDPWEPLKSAAEQVLGENGWRVTESWNSAALGSCAAVGRIPVTSGEPQDEGDAELDATLDAANSELLAAIKGFGDHMDAGIEQVTGIPMTALYRQLHDQGLPDDPAFDVEAGLRDIKKRIQRERADADRAERPDL